ncbi:MAG: leucine-rich repeat domain-containing protein [Eubacterium sp.]|nr:leucine-rich repeat domain-containing protein [Eubacterium sp.]
MVKKFLVRVCVVMMFCSAMISSHGMNSFVMANDGKESIILQQNTETGKQSNDLVFTEERQGCKYELKDSTLTISGDGAAWAFPQNQHKYANAVNKIIINGNIKDGYKVICSCSNVYEIELPGSALKETFSIDCRYSRHFEYVKVTSSLPKKSVKYLYNIYANKIILLGQQKNYKLCGSVLCTKDKKTAVAFLPQAEEIVFPKECQSVNDIPLEYCSSKIIFNKNIKSINMTKKYKNRGACRYDVDLDMFDLKNCKLKGSELDKLLWVTSYKYDRNGQIKEWAKKYPKLFQLKNGFLISGDTLISYDISLKWILPDGYFNEDRDEGEGQYQKIICKKSVVIPKKIKIIGYGAFYAASEDAVYGNDSLKKISLKKGTKLKRIRSFAFGGCENLKKVKTSKSVKVEKNAYY